MRRPTAAIAVLVALAASGCGAESTGGEFSGEEERVAQAVEDLQEAGQKGDERRICRQLLAQDLARELGDCNATVEEALKTTDSFELTVEDVQVSGSTATAEVRAGRATEETRTVRLTKEGEAWKVAYLGEPAA